MEATDQEEGTLVLVVDDDPGIRLVVRTLLKLDLGARVLLAADGAQALSLIEKRLPALVVTDVRMPRLDGVGLVSRLKSCPTTRHIPILVMTSTPECRDAALSAGADDYLDKPFDLRALSLKLRAHLDPQLSQVLSQVEE